MRIPSLVAGLCLSGLCALAQAALAEQKLLAEVVERQFLFNLALSYSGTLAVEQVHYRLEVVDQWTDGAATEEIKEVVTQGNCPQLLEPHQRYLLSLTGQTLERDGRALALVACDAQPEKDAQEVIAALNQARKSAAQLASRNQISTR